MICSDFHIPYRTTDLPLKFKKLLTPNKMQHILCAGNLCTKETLEWLRSLASDVHMVRGDFDDSQYPDSKIISVGQYRIGLIHGHQAIESFESDVLADRSTAELTLARPWNDLRIRPF